MALKDHQADMECCSRCSACKFIPLEKVTGYEHVNVCPSITRHNFHTYSGGGRMGFGLGIIHGRVEYTPRTSEVIFDCNLCGACDVSCKYGMEFDVLEPLYAMREECVAAGQAPRVWDRLVEGMSRGAPTVLAPGAKRGDWAIGLGAKDYTKEKAGVIYHAGCLAGTDATAGRVAAAAVSLLQKAGVDVGIAGAEELCCGGRSYEMGYREKAIEQARLLVRRFEESGATELVTGCAHCYQYFKVLYPKLGVKHSLKVRHTTEYLVDLVRDGRLTPAKPVDMIVTYHDPCHLGRLSEPWIEWKGEQREPHFRVYDPPRVLRRGSGGVYEPPRELLRSIPGVKLVEMDRSKEYAWCCGAGGGVAETNPGFAAWTAAERLSEAVSSGAEVLATACSHCRKNLSGPSTDVEVLDVVEILDKAI